MAGFDNKGDLTAAVLDFLSEDSLDSGVADRLIALADGDIRADIGILSLERKEIVEIGPNDEESAAPDRYIGPIRRMTYIVGGKRYTPRYQPPDILSRNFDATPGLPKNFTVEGRQDQDAVIIWSPIPDREIDVTCVYVASNELLEADDTNYLLLNYPGIYLYGALKHAEAYLRDASKLDTYRSMYDEIAGKVQFAETTRRNSGPLMQVRSRYVA